MSNNTKGVSRRDFLKTMYLTGLHFALIGCGEKGSDTITNMKAQTAGKIKMKKQQFSKVIVLGIDGLDPKILKSMMEKGELPNFSILAKTGAFAPLRTSNPPQSPVAWSSIACGSNAGYHGIYDFIRRNPEDYIPDLSILKVNPKNIFGSRDSMFLPVRKGNPFWAITSEAGIPSTVVKWPVTFPPRKTASRILAGLGVPDIRGGLGRYTFYTTKEIPSDEEGKEKVIKVVINNQEIKTHILGPSVQTLRGKKNSEIPMSMHMDSNAKVRIDIQDKSHILREGEWSEWIQLKFDTGFFTHKYGICRFFLLRMKPEFELYLTPIQVDPKEPCFPISHPDDYAREITNHIGEYYTLGIPEDTKALTEKRLSEEAFLGMCDQIVNDQEKMLWYELERFKEGLLAFVFFTTDRIQHIFWVTRDPKHPLYSKAYAHKYSDIINGYYRRMDKVLGRTMECVDDKTAIIVCSDHGFTSFRRSVQLNTWLVENGYMTLSRKVDPLDKEGGPLFRYVDWGQTKAYALGFGSIYLNIKGREGQGTVNKGDEQRQLVAEIKERILQFKDHKTEGLVIRQVYEKEKIYNGPCVDDAPDLVVGFQPGYRMSWQSAIGGTPGYLIEDNLKKWTGDHCVDPSAVPGIFLMNRRINTDSPALIDIAPTVLACFGIPKPDHIDGKCLILPNPHDL